MIALSFPNSPFSRKRQREHLSSVLFFSFSFCKFSFPSALCTKPSLIDIEGKRKREIGSTSKKKKISHHSVCTKLEDFQNTRRLSRSQSIRQNRPQVHWTSKEPLEFFRTCCWIVFFLKNWRGFLRLECTQRLTEKDMADQGIDRKLESCTFSSWEFENSLPRLQRAQESKNKLLLRIRACAEAKLHFSAEFCSVFFSQNFLREISH